MRTIIIDDREANLLVALLVAEFVRDDLDQIHREQTEALIQKITNAKDAIGGRHVVS